MRGCIIIYLVLSQETMASPKKVFVPITELPPGVTLKPFFWIQQFSNLDQSQSRTGHAASVSFLDAMIDEGTEPGQAAMAINLAEDLGRGINIVNMTLTMNGHSSGHALDFSNQVDNSGAPLGTTGARSEIKAGYSKPSRLQLFHHTPTLGPLAMVSVNPYVPQDAAISEMLGKRVFYNTPRFGVEPDLYLLDKLSTSGTDVISIPACHIRLKTGEATLSALVSTPFDDAQDNWDLTLCVSGWYYTGWTKTCVYPTRMTQTGAFEPNLTVKPIENPDPEAPGAGTYWPVRWSDRVLCRSHLMYFEGFQKLLRSEGLRGFGALCATLKSDNETVIFDQGTGTKPLATADAGLSSQLRRLSKKKLGKGKACGYTAKKKLSKCRKSSQACRQTPSLY